MKPGKQRIYSKAFEGRDDIVKWDVRPISDGQIIKITFLSKNSPYEQGVRIATDRGIDVNGQVFPGVRVWYNPESKEVTHRCLTRDGLLSVYNVWDRGSGVMSLLHTSGMVIEEKGNLLIYHCNDSGLETSFDKLVFSIEFLQSAPS